jgi:hypothetical protein
VGGCVVVEGKCVDECYSLMSREDCGRWEYCAWMFSRYSGDDGRCIWKKEHNYSCSDIKRFSDCSTGGNISVLFEKCEFYKGRCRERCSLFLNEEKCLKDGDCVWLNSGNKENEIGSCSLKVCCKLYLDMFFYELLF